MLRDREVFARRVQVAITMAVAVGAAVAVGGDHVWGQEQVRRQTAGEIARAQVQDAADRLRSEIRMLTELRDAQASLQKWNAQRIATGEAPTVLDRDLCRFVEEWCAALPATFGKGKSERRAR